MKKIQFSWLAVMTILLFFNTATYSQKKDFVTVKDKQFILSGKPYYFIGTNYWYGAMLGSKGEGGDRERLGKELDFLKASGITNLRVLAGAEGPDDQPFRVTPALQTAPGKYSDVQLDGLDYFMAEAGKRGIKVVLFLNNSWEWSGGFMQYLNWNGYGPIPYMQYKENTWESFKAYTTQFHTCEPCKEQYFNHVRFMLSRTNAYTRVKYIDDPAIMSWEIANEPRAFSEKSIPAFTNFIDKSSQLIRSLDPNHLITTGSEGQAGTEDSMELFRKIHSFKTIDYLTFHIWPNNWGWLDKKNVPGSVDRAIAKTNEYIENHVKVANELNKPVVFEEFGLPRDNFQFNLIDPTVSRDKYYKNAFELVVSHAKKGGVLGGCNLWAFGGSARPVSNQVFWKKGDAFMGDPPQEEQGLNAVFDTDSTMELIRLYTKNLKKAGSQKGK